MVKTNGVTLVVLATLLAGFVASCAGSDLPSVADIQSSDPTAQAEAEDEPPGLTSSPESLNRAAPTGVPTVTVLPTVMSPAATVAVATPVAATVVPAAATNEPTATVTFESQATPAAPPLPDPATAPAPPRIQPDAGTYRGPTRVYIGNDNDGLDLYYTLDGSSPTAQNGTKYEGPFEIYDDATVVAAFLSADGVATGQTVAKYSIEKPPLDTPSITLSSGLYIGE